MVNGIQHFWVTDHGRTAYSVYPDSGNDRFYDDNVWIGLDMAKWYAISKNIRYLNQAKAVWNYLSQYGWDNTCGGGVHWKELNEPSKSKHTCSTAPTGVLSCKLYQLTHEQKYLDKAQVLIEALPYIQRFNRKIIVVKYGGSAMVDESLKRRVIEDVTLLKLCGFKPIIVHGGGKEISKWVGKVGKEAEFINGLRVTDAETMEIAEMVLGRVNKSLVQLVESLGVRAIGISGKDGNLLQVEKKFSDGQDIGFVGDVKKVNAEILYDLLEKDFLPIICPVGMDEEYNTYNINADDAACAIARAMKVEKLAFLTDIEGVYKDPKDPSTLISELEIKEAKELITDGYIGGGMLPKLQNCIDAIESGVSRVHILDGRIPHCLLLEIFTNKGIGTAILNQKESRYYDGEQ